MKTLVLSILCFMLIDVNEVQAYFTMTGTIKNLSASLTIKDTYADTDELCIDKRTQGAQEGEPGCDPPSVRVSLCWQVCT